MRTETGVLCFGALVRLLLVVSVRDFGVDAVSQIALLVLVVCCVVMPLLFFVARGVFAVAVIVFHLALLAIHTYRKLCRRERLWLIATVLAKRACNPSNLFFLPRREQLAVPKRAADEWSGSRQ